MTEGNAWGRQEPAIASPFAILESGRRWSAFAAATLVSVLLLGCSEPVSPSPDAGADPRPAATPAAPLPAPAEASPVPAIGDVVWATTADPVTNAPQDEVTSFPPSALRITAFVLVSALPPGSTVQADWTYNDTTLDAFSRQIIVPTETRQTWFSFHVERGEAELWPDGDYEISISLNGQIARQAAIQVAASP